MRRTIFGATAAAVSLGIATALPLAATAATPNAASADLALNKASIAGGIKTTSLGLSMTFVFTAKNNGPSTAEPDLTITTVTNVDEADGQFTCVDRSGRAYYGDTPGCEPGYISSGASVGSDVFTGTVTQSTGSVSVRACVSDLNGLPDPVPSNNCKTLSVPIK